MNSDRSPNKTVENSTETSANSSSRRFGILSNMRSMVRGRKKGYLLLVGAVLLFVIGIGVFYLTSRFLVEPIGVRVTNVTSNSATITWATDTTQKAVAIAVPEGADLKRFIVGEADNGIVGFDDRDYSQAELELAESNQAMASDGDISGTELKTEVEVEKYGSYKTHHVTFRGLDPESNYTIYIGDGNTFKLLSDEESQQFTTLSTLKELTTPDPIYGRVLDRTDDIPTPEPLTDGVFYYYLENDAGERTSSYISAPLANNGSWYLDITSLRSPDGGDLLETYSEDEIFSFKRVGEVRSVDGALYRTEVPPYEDAPARDFILLEEYQVIDESPLQSFMSFVSFESYAGWVHDCGGGQQCFEASASDMATFEGYCAANNCDAEQRWQSEAAGYCGTGAASTCGGGGGGGSTPPPQEPGTGGTLPGAQCADGVCGPTLYSCWTDPDGAGCEWRQCVGGGWVEAEPMCTGAGAGQQAKSPGDSCTVGSFYPSENGCDGYGPLECLSCGKCGLPGSEAQWCTGGGAGNGGTTGGTTGGTNQVCCIYNIEGTTWSEPEVVDSSDCPVGTGDYEILEMSACSDNGGGTTAPSNWGSCSNIPENRPDNPPGCGTLDNCSPGEWCGILNGKPCTCGDTASISCGTQCTESQYGEGDTSCPTALPSGADVCENSDLCNDGEYCNTIDNGVCNCGGETIQCGQKCTIEVPEPDPDPDPDPVPNLPGNGQACGSAGCKDGYDCDGFQSDVDPGVCIPEQCFGYGQSTCPTGYHCNAPSQYGTGQCVYTVVNSPDPSLPTIFEACNATCAPPFTCLPSGSCGIASGSTCDWSNDSDWANKPSLWCEAGWCDEDEMCTANDANGTVPAVVTDPGCTDELLEYNGIEGSCQSDCANKCSGAAQCNEITEDLEGPNSYNWTFSVTYHTCQYPEELESLTCTEENLEILGVSNAMCESDCNDACSANARCTENVIWYTDPDTKYRIPIPYYQCIVNPPTPPATPDPAPVPTPPPSPTPPPTSTPQPLPGANRDVLGVEDVLGSSVIFDPRNRSYVVDDSGLYKFWYNGVEYQVILRDEQKDYQIYLDLNMNSVLEEGEPIVEGEPVELQFAKDLDLAKFPLSAGHNLVSFDFVVEGVAISASSLLEKLNDDGYQVLSIATFNSGSWQVVGYREDGNYGAEDFQIVPGVGYLIKVPRDMEISLLGFSILDPVPISLSPGWNLVGIAGSDTSYTAESWIDSLNANTFTVDNVSRWASDKGRYDGLQKELDENDVAQVYGFDFPILVNNGYFVRVLQGEGLWTPE